MAKRYPHYYLFWVALVGLLATSNGCVILANRFSEPARFETIPVSIALAPTQADPAQEELTILSWNLGYAGLGAEADFFMDGGRQYRPASGKLVDKNLDGIIGFLSNTPADLLVLQEVAKTSWITRQRDVLGSLQKALPHLQWTYSDDLKTAWVSWPLRIRIGNATASKVAVIQAETRALPLEKNFVAGIFRKHYRMHIVRLFPDWVVVNVHLSAFDSLEDDVRSQQLQAVLDFATAEYAAGNRVVVGGDWNFTLVESSFPHQTAEEFLFWIRDLPDWARLDGWRWIADPLVPSVRTMQQAYVEGINHTLVIDGFLVSPNVEVVRFGTVDMGFAYSDHQPTLLTVRR